MRRYSKKKYTAEQIAWCQKYERETSFEPLMDDFDGGKSSFLEAANLSVRWFEDWSTDAHIRISKNIPGAAEALMAKIGVNT